ncbi:MAG: response regulator transcription factor [Planctomycetota bacterium]
MIHVVDDDEAVRDSVQALVQHAGYSVCAYTSGEEFLAKYERAGAGCVLLDVRMPGISGIELFRQLNASEFDLPVLFISGHGDVPMAVGAVKSGAFDFVEKPYSPELLLQKIEAALASFAGKAESLAERQAVLARIARLTSRERQVLERVVDGHPNKAIAAALGISQKTIETHRFRIMRKMEAKNLPDLVKMVLLVRDRAAPHA